ncbi:septum formation protein Maf [Candidatus Micrarchaeota archaeon]|nr:septum formation protein Maf [Candidatus Micrarchaeota archaeon]MBI5176604.1 septum formation protein Maf [Candidatus Micrarchaeota archaeon]
MKTEPAGLKTGIVLASNSPGRRHVLEREGIAFTVVPSEGVEEMMDASVPVEEMVVRNALAKAREVASRAKGGIILGADTVVCCGNKLIGKPKGRNDAEKILLELSGKWHEIITGIALVDAAGGKAVSGVGKTRIRFRKLNAAEVRHYIDTGEWEGKAGGYAIQGKGSALIEKWEGSFTNAIGLPVEKLPELEKELGGKKA